MGWILFKRAVRDLKAGWARYIALSLLIIFSIFIVTSLMGAAATVIDYTELRDRELCREDGEFSVFVPLRDEELSKITSRGVSVEKMFFADYPLNDQQVLRVFRVRENINRISIIEGALPANDGEAVIERRFSEVNGVHLGDKVRLGSKEFTVSGIGAVPDYNNLLKKVSDSVIDSKSFGLLFLTSKAYEELIELNHKMGAAANNISHLYTELARLQMLSVDTIDKASTSIAMALRYNKNNDAARNLLSKIESSKKTSFDAKIAADFVIDVNENSLVPSVMIVTDIKEHRFDNPKIVNTRQITASLADSLLNEAKKAREVSKSQSYLIFLEAAKVYSELPVGSYDYQNYLYAMAYYAMLKADSLYAKYKNYSHTANADVKELEMLKDSACSYYRESLNLVSDVTPESLVAIVTNYLKLEIAQQQAIKGQRTYFNGDLKTIFSDCIEGGDELKAAAIRMVLSCGSTSIKVWNTLCNDGFIGEILTNRKVRMEVFDIINIVGGTDIDKSQKPKEFF